ncbi:carbamoyltransferase HypF [Methanolobus sp. ZRKC3]|uniref:carbamoyltransferase HypF n=1 Tax=Methanolobus sp. ZRKC3 TaxID=3125786 RepID=UPI0032471BD0
MPQTCKKIMVEGIVQGVGFRPFVYRMAKKHELHGYVKNAGGRVEIIVQGSKRQIDNFLHDLQFENPAQSQIDKLECKEADLCHYTDFSIVKSNTANTPNSILVPDIGICKNCLAELSDPQDRRYGYPFISCTECGPRYTLTESLPYDRHNTSMAPFHPCTICDSEYTTPSDRRFHAQTVCCQKCGPKVSFADNSGSISSRGNNAIIECAGSIDAGKVIAVKGYGGFHLVCDAFQENAVELLRNRIGRSQQPFAVMARDIETVRQLVNISAEEEEILMSSKRPIVVLDKKEEQHILKGLAPGLHNVGVMLAYSGIHQLLFQHTSSSVYVMSSANIPSLPMVIDNDIAIRELSAVVDNYLLHDLKIENRIDDSVIRFISGKPVFIRRSRGYVPQAIKLPFEVRPCVGVGAELSNTIMFASGDKAYISPHIGNTGHFETAMYHADVFRNFSDLTSIKPERWGCDLHPQFNTTRFAMENGGDAVVPVQHHHAHVVSLMADAGLDRNSRIIGIALDGVGYGTDGTVWGGGILESSYTDFRRCAHLKPQPMAGGDVCSYYPERMVLGMLKDMVETDELMKLPFELKHGLREARTVLGQLDKNINVVMSSSAGRVLDAASALLGICRYRSYQGEPAMKLESTAKAGKETSLELPVIIKDDVFDTSMLLYELYVRLGEYPITELAHAFEDAFAQGIAQLALSTAKRTGIDIIGLTGGVAYNEHINSGIRDKVEEAGFKFITHSRIPCGDGGISLGQALVASLKDEK